MLLQPIVWGHSLMRKLFLNSSLAVKATVLALGLTAANAQSSGVPAEFPPSSFTGKQYVDSKGCVFIRAGFDGAVNWVPRVNRKRKALCGFSPTFASEPSREDPSATVIATKPEPAAESPRPTEIVVAKPCLRRRFDQSLYPMLRHHRALRSLSIRQLELLRHLPSLSQYLRRHRK